MDEEEQRGSPPSARRRWAPVVVLALALLALSQALWLWESWPVRHLLGEEPPAANGGTGT